jgi:small neutral amino acid transporter SnatA (MarC family)
MVGWSLALLSASLVTTVILVFADNLSKLLGERGLIAIEHLMGMILTTLAVQMFLSGISMYFHLPH